MVAGLFQRADFGLGERRRLARIIAAGIFAPRPERQAEEGGRQLVMLRIGGVGVNGDRIVGHAPGKAGFVRKGGSGNAFGGPATEPIDPGERNTIRNGRALDRPDDAGNEIHGHTPESSSSVAEARRCGRAPARLRATPGRGFVLRHETFVFFSP